MSLSAHNKSTVWIIVLLVSANAMLIGVCWQTASRSGISENTTGKNAPNEPVDVIRVGDDGTPHGMISVKVTVSTHKDGYSRWSYKTIALPASKPEPPITLSINPKEGVLCDISYLLSARRGGVGVGHHITYKVYKRDSKYILTLGVATLQEFSAPDDAAAMIIANSWTDLYVASFLTEELADALARKDYDAIKERLGIEADFVQGGRSLFSSTKRSENQQNPPSQNTLGEQIPSKPVDVIHIDDDWVAHGKVSVKVTVSTLMDGHATSSFDTISLPASMPEPPRTFTNYSKDWALYEISYLMSARPGGSGAGTSFTYVVHKSDSNYIITRGAVPIQEFTAIDDNVALLIAHGLTDSLLASYLIEELAVGLESKNYDAVRWLGLNAEFIKEGEGKIVIPEIVIGPDDVSSQPIE